MATSSSLNGRSFLTDAEQFGANAINARSAMRRDIKMPKTAGGALESAAGYGILGYQVGSGVGKTLSQHLADSELANSGFNASASDVLASQAGSGAVNSIPGYEAGMAGIESAGSGVAGAGGAAGGTAAAGGAGALSIPGYEAGMAGIEGAGAGIAGGAEGAATGAGTGIAAGTAAGAGTGAAVGTGVGTTVGSSVGSGAATGSSAGPWGAAIGAVVGLAAYLLS